MIVEPEQVMQRFRAWMEGARNHPGIAEPTAMSLGTIDADGTPSVRMVLLKSADERGFTFYTNQESRKGRALHATHKAALCFYWMPLERQVRIEGTVERVTDEESDDYFASRARDSQLGAWASHQSEVLENADALARAVEAMRAKFEGQAVPRPHYWVGFRVVPKRVEFWQGKPHRLHERELFTWTHRGWKMERLYP